MSKNNLPSLALTPQITEAFAPQVLEVMRSSIAKDATDAEFLLFAHKAASYGLDPFKNEIFFIKYGSTARIQFAADAYLSKAREKEGFQPPDTQMVHENDEFKIAMNKQTKEMEVVLHEIGFPRGRIIGAYSIAYRDGHRPVTVIMDIEEVDHMFKGQNKDNWNKWTSDMFGKHVQQRALKRQYGLEFEDETITNDEGPAVPEYQPRERKDITPNQEVIDQPKDQPIGNPEVDKLNAAKNEMQKKFKQLGITGKEAKKVYIDEKSPKFDGSLAQVNALLDIMDMELDLMEMQNNADADSLE